MTQAFNMDCMEAMREFPDNFFDLAVVDPPYGDGSQNVQVERERAGAESTTDSAGCSRSRSAASGQGRFGGRFDKYKRPEDAWNQQGGYHGKKTHDLCERTGGTWVAKYGKKIIAWDVAPEKEYFDELFRVSRNQIIWGGNYFDLPPTRCFVIFRKTNIPEKGFSMAPVEYAWTSFFRNAEYIEAFTQGRPGQERFHPTQKPVKLYAEIYRRFAVPGMKILDTHLGSGSSRIAAYDAGLDFWGYEIDKIYFDLQEERFAAHAAQTSLFIGGD